MKHTKGYAQELFDKRKTVPHKICYYIWLRRIESIIDRFAKLN